MICCFFLTPLFRVLVVVVFAVVVNSLRLLLEVMLVYIAFCHPKSLVLLWDRLLFPGWMSQEAVEPGLFWF